MDQIKIQKLGDGSCVAWQLVLVVERFLGKNPRNSVQSDESPDDFEGSEGSF